MPFYIRTDVATIHGIDDGRPHYFRVAWVMGPGPSGPFDTVTIVAEGRYNDRATAKIVCDRIASLADEAGVYGYPDTYTLPRGYKWHPRFLYRNVRDCIDSLRN